MYCQCQFHLAISNGIELRLSILSLKQAKTAPALTPGKYIFIAKLSFSLKMQMKLIEDFGHEVLLLQPSESMYLFRSSDVADNFKLN